MITPIVKDFEKIVTKMQSKDLNGLPYFMYGHPQELSNVLTEMTGTEELKYKKYPLIALRLDIIEKVDSDMIRVNLNIAIVTMTDINYRAAQRTDIVFVPVLYPLYEKFMLAIKHSGIFTWEGPSEKPPHTKIDRYYYGSQLANKNVFNDPLDAIELLDLKLNKRIKC